MVADFGNITPDFGAQAKAREAQYGSLVKHITPQTVERTINEGLRCGQLVRAIKLDAYMHPLTPSYLTLRANLLANPHIKSVDLIKSDWYGSIVEYQDFTKDEIKSGWQTRDTDFLIRVEIKKPTVPFGQKLKNIAQRFLPESTKAKIEDTTKAKLFEEYDAHSKALIAAIKKMPDLKVDTDKLTEAVEGIKALLESPNIRYSNEMSPPRTQLKMMVSNFENHAEFLELQTTEALKLLEQSFTTAVRNINTVRSDVLERRAQSLGFETAGQISALDPK